MIVSSVKGLICVVVIGWINLLLMCLYLCYLWDWYPVSYIAYKYGCIDWNPYNPINFFMQKFSLSDSIEACISKHVDLKWIFDNIPTKYVKTVIAKQL
jgi:hypothetical protein